MSTELTDKAKEVMQEVRQKIAIANAQELFNCVEKPSDRLSSSEQQCLSKCLDRYREAWDVVSKTYTSRLQREYNQ